MDLFKPKSRVGAGSSTKAGGTEGPAEEGTDGSAWIVTDGGADMGGRDEALFTASEATPLPQRGKRKGEELTPPEVRRPSDKELFKPVRGGAKTGVGHRGLGHPADVASSTDDEAPDAKGSGEEAEVRESHGLCPKGKKRRKATSHGSALLREDSGAIDAGSEGSWQGPVTRGRGALSPLTLAPAPRPTGPITQRTATLSGEESPDGIGLAEHRMKTAADLGAQIRDWLDEIEGIRMRCKSLQGRLSGGIKKRVAWAKDALLTLTAKAEASGDPDDMRARMMEQAAQLQVAHRERDEARRELAEVRRELERARGQAVDRNVTTFASVTRGTVAERAVVHTGPESRGRAFPPLNLRVTTEGSGLETEPPTPATGGTSASEPRLTAAELELLPVSARAREEAIERQLSAIREVWVGLEKVSARLQRLEGGSMGKNPQQLRAEPEPLAEGGEARAVLGADRAPASNGGRYAREYSSTQDAATPSVSGTAAHAAGDPEKERRRSKKETSRTATGGERATADVGNPKQGASGKTGVPPRNGDASTGGPKAPRTAAVAITGLTGEIPYGDILRKARQRLERDQVDIPYTKVRRAANGGVLLEISGPAKAQRADELAAQLDKAVREEFGDKVRVTRPTRKAELRVKDLDDSATVEEVQQAVASEEGCRPQEVKVGPLRQMANGLLSAWVQCPVEAATPVTRGGRIRVGWARARVELLEVHPTQCFRCWGFSHIGASCRAAAPRSRACFRCGIEGHQARACTAPPRCVICAEGGRDSAHRIASGRCPAARERDRTPAAAQFAAEAGVDICLISEPPLAPDTPRWISSADRRAAISWGAGECRQGCRPSRRGRVFVSVTYGEMTVISVYISPNVSREKFTASLDELGQAVRSASSDRGVLVGGDFNARSAAWDPTGRNNRREQLEIWAASLGLCLLNDGATPTCVRPQGCSVVDTTWASPGLAARVTGWRVLTNVENLSCLVSRDGPGIVCEVTDQAQAYAPPAEGVVGRRWNYNQFEPSKFSEALELHLAWGPTGAEKNTAEGLAKWIGQAVRDACDAAAPRVRPRPRRRAVHWWSEEIAELRKACVRARRLRSRTNPARRADSPRDDEYKAAKKRLKDGIKAAKARAWQDLVKTVEEDPWGRPYKVVLNKLRGPSGSLTETLNPDTTERLLTSLFPQGPQRPPRDRGLIAECYTRCLCEGKFPREWKTARLVLIPKGGEVAGAALPKVRPICLLNELGKGLERVLAGRLKDWVRTNHEAGLADGQFGFREGRATSDALLRVRDFAKNALARGDTAIAVSLDIANAFNSVPWETIRAALRRKGIPGYLRRIVGSYLSSREVVYPAPGGATGRWQVSAGVPQGSVLGPLLWNLSFDGVLRVHREQGCDIICYADDTLVLSSAAKIADAIVLANVQVTTVVRHIRRMGLTVSAAKTQAMAFGGGRRRPSGGAPCLRVEGELVELGRSIRYLGVTLDGKLTFQDHFDEVETKVARLTRALFRLMPNLGGPTEPRRRLYASVLHSVVLYGAPVWGDEAISRRAERTLQRIQRAINIRVAAAYRTVSLVAGSLLVRAPPLALVARARARTFTRLRERQNAGEVVDEGVRLTMLAEERRAVHAQWREDLNRPGLPSGPLREAIQGAWEGWIARKHGAMTFRLSQILTGHGCFEGFLHRIGRATDPSCKHCGGEIDSVEHAIAECPAWKAEREELQSAIGLGLGLGDLVHAMARDKQGWAAVAKFAERVMTAKEVAERERQQQGAQAAEQLSSDTASGG
ncbi:uncharacterized protein LOC124409153 [Diprion similis]|uniref:uncharacterized protein LOC124409153 n=1 Tax=Diprion similis TaxID=362088 RepID=UPI001EF9A109|nr:uncharacterized protein LOC124409153 [Diprion similis]